LLSIRDGLAAHLEAERGNVAAVARAMGKAPAQVHRWMRRYGLNPESYRHRVESPKSE
jgi:transposase-like protein